jgi:DNA-binding HxlR family transcriptional regulator
LDSLLKRHVIRMTGVVKGRDVTRQALKQRDSMIEDLKTRIRELQEAIETHRVSGDVLNRRLRSLEEF